MRDAAAEGKIMASQYKMGVSSTFILILSGSPISSCNGTSRDFDARNLLPGRTRPENSKDREPEPTGR